jgi:RNA polymerase sigma factor (sigma-70 family)
VSSITAHAGPARRPLRSRRLLALAGDDRLVQQIRAGNEAAFEVAFQRHAPAILAFCRHMLRSRDEAEDVVQHTFSAAYSGLLDRDRDIALKPWLFAIARNRCISLLRRPRPDVAGPDELPTAGLAEEVERRAELRELLADVKQLPDEQRMSLLLVEIGDLSHAEVAGVLECEVSHVKALVYRGRQSLIERREARATPCEAIREQLANLRGGALRRSELRHHLRDCPGCTAFRQQVKQQRGMLAVALPVVPSAGLKASVLGAAGLGGGSAGGGVGLATLGAASTAGSGGALLAKVAVVGVLAAGGTAVAEKRMSGDADPPRRDARVVGPLSPPTEPSSIRRMKIDTPGSRLPARPRSRSRGGGLPAASPGPTLDHGRTASRAHGPGQNATGRKESPGTRAQEPQRRSDQAAIRAQGPPHPDERTPPARGRAEPPEQAGWARDAAPPRKTTPGGGSRRTTPKE